MSVHIHSYSFESHVRLGTKWEITEITFLRRTSLYVEPDGLSVYLELPAVHVLAGGGLVLGGELVVEELADDGGLAHAARAQHEDAVVALGRGQVSAVAAVDAVGAAVAAVDALVVAVQAGQPGPARCGGGGGWERHVVLLAPAPGRVVARNQDHALCGRQSPGMVCHLVI